MQPACHMSTRCSHGQNLGLHSSDEEMSIQPNRFENHPRLLSNLRDYQTPVSTLPLPKKVALSSFIMFNKRIRRYQVSLHNLPDPYRSSYINQREVQFKFDIRRNIRKLPNFNCFTRCSIHNQAQNSVKQTQHTYLNFFHYYSQQIFNADQLRVGAYKFCRLRITQR